MYFIGGRGVSELFPSRTTSFSSLGQDSSTCLEPQRCSGQRLGICGQVAASSFEVQSLKLHLRVQDCRLKLFRIPGLRTFVIRFSL